MPPKKNKKNKKQKRKKLSIPKKKRLIIEKNLERYNAKRVKIKLKKSKKAKAFFK